MKYAWNVLSFFLVALIPLVASAQQANVSYPNPGVTGGSIGVEVIAWDGFGNLQSRSGVGTPGGGYTNVGLSGLGGWQAMAVGNLTNHDGGNKARFNNTSAVFTIGGVYNAQIGAAAVGQANPQTTNVTIPITWNKQKFIQYGITEGIEVNAMIVPSARPRNSSVTWHMLARLGEDYADEGQVILYFNNVHYLQQQCAYDILVMRLAPQRVTGTINSVSKNYDVQLKNRSYRFQPPGVAGNPGLHLFGQTYEIDWNITPLP